MDARKGPSIAPVLYLLTIVHMALIFYLSSTPSIAQPGILEDIPNIDKLEHLTEFLLLGVLMFLSFHLTASEKVRANAWALAIMGSVLYAMTDEVHQLFVPGRCPDLIDLLSDTAGIALSGLFGAWVSDNWPAGAGRGAPTIGLKGRMLDSEE